jgi:hypothetical protein
VNAAEVKEMLEDVAELLSYKEISPMARLERINRVLESHKCLCGRWRRGGERQGSALCEQCYRRDDK